MWLFIVFALVVGVLIGPSVKTAYQKARGTYVDLDTPVHKIEAVRGILPIPPEYLNPDGSICYPPHA